MPLRRGSTPRMSTRAVRELANDASLPRRGSWPWTTERTTSTKLPTSGDGSLRRQARPICHSEFVTSTHRTFATLASCADRATIETPRPTPERFTIVKNSWAYWTTRG
jgi:hypothetical protein